MPDIHNVEVPVLDSGDFIYDGTINSIYGNNVTMQWELFAQLMSPGTPLVADCNDHKYQGDSEPTGWRDLSGINPYVTRIGRPLPVYLIQKDEWSANYYGNLPTVKHPNQADIYRQSNSISTGVEYDVDWPCPMTQTNIEIQISSSSSQLYA